MDETIKLSIEGRKNAIINTYELNDKQKKEVDDLFIKIEKLGMEAKDSSDFEAKFAASPLNQEYMDLFTKIATEGAKSDLVKGTATSVATGIAESAIRNAVGVKIPTTRAAVHQEVYNAARDIPGVGEVLQVKQYADLFGRFKKKKDE